MVLSAQHLSIDYQIGKTWFNVIRDVTLTVYANEIHGLVGESGSGKSTLALALMRYLEPNARITNGKINFEGLDLVRLTNRDMANIWGKRISLVPQNPLDALNPSMTIAAQMAELTQQHLRLSAKQAFHHVCESLESVKIADPDRVLKRYPHQLSGGMQQRVMIAMALSTRPSLLILDEPTTALDVTTQAVILDLVRELVKREGASALYVSHNLGTIAQLCDTVTVLYGGEIMETAPVKTLFAHPTHPYTIGLLASLPRATTESEARLPTIAGVAPALQNRPAGCAFASRCPVAVEQCHAEKPPLAPILSEHLLRCWRGQDIHAGQVIPQTLPPSPPKTLSEITSLSPVLSVQQLRKTYKESRLIDRLLGRQTSAVNALDSATFHVNTRSTVGIVGESGSGKTTLARAIVGLETADSGQIALLGVDIPRPLTERSQQTLRNLRLIFQNPNDALNPYKTIGQSIGRTIQRLDSTLSTFQIRQKVAEMLIAVGLTPAYADRLPTQLSGGEKQRVAIARAFSAHPALIIADEPTSALDVSVQAVIINLLKDMRAKESASYIIISHDLEVISTLADWIIVLYLGEIVEQGTTTHVYNAPMHPYTEALLSAIPSPNPTERLGDIRLEGDVPSPRHKPSGCPFHTRCPRYIGDICKTHTPPLHQTPDGHQIRCHHSLDTLKTLQVSPLMKGQ